MLVRGGSPGVTEREEISRGLAESPSNHPPGLTAHDSPRYLLALLIRQHPPSRHPALRSSNQPATISRDALTA